MPAHKLMKFSRFSSVRGNCVGQRFIERSRQVDRILSCCSNRSFSVFNHQIFNHRSVSTFLQKVNMLVNNLVLWITIVERSVIMKEIAVEMWLREFSISNLRNVGFLNQLEKRNRRSIGTK